MKNTKFWHFVYTYISLTIRIKNERFEIITINIKVIVIMNINFK